MKVTLIYSNRRMKAFSIEYSIEEKFNLIKMRELLRRERKFERAINECNPVTRLLKHNIVSINKLRSSR